MRISQILHIWLLEFILILQVSTSIRHCERGDRLNSKVSPANLSSLSNLSSLPRLPYAHDERQLPKSSRVQSQQQMILLCAVIALLLLILVALVPIMYRISLSSAERRGRIRLPKPHLLAETGKHEAEAGDIQPDDGGDIRPDDTVQWMWGDANMMNRLSGDAGHSLAQRDPLRWSRWKRLGATIVDLADRMDVQHANRPVEMRTRRTKAILYFKTVDDALAALRKHAEAASILPDDTVQWMWGDANVLGHLARAPGHSLAHRDPLHWSRWMRVGATTLDLVKFKDVRNANRPVKIRTKRSMVSLHFDTVGEALSALRDEALLPNPSSTEVSQNQAQTSIPLRTSSQARVFDHAAST